MFKNVYKGRRVLVTGHTGFKGSWLSEWLLHLGAEVAGYSKYLPSEPCNFSVIDLGRRMRHHEGDIRDAARLENMFAEFQPEFVFHLAAQPIVSASFSDPRSTFETNVMGTVNIIEAVRKTPSVVSLILVTSDKCYENVEWEFGYREQDRLGGKDPYSASKACAEIAFSAYFKSFFKDKEKNVRMASVRAGNVIGGGDWAKDRIVPDCMRSWGAGKEVVLRNPASTRPWQHVLEPLSGYLWLGALLAEDRPDLNGEAFNFGPDPDVIWPVQTLVEKMAAIWQGARLRVDPATALAGKEASLLKLCCDKAISRTGWQATLSFDETVDMTVDWYRTYYRSPESGIAAFTRGQIETYARCALKRGRPWVK